MILSSRAGALGVIRTGSGVANAFSRMIEELAAEELLELFDYWLMRNRCTDEVTRIVVHRQIHRELLAFFVCLTERFATRHHVPNARELIDVIADGAREASLVDPRTSYPVKKNPQPDAFWLESSARRIEVVRTRHAYREPQSIVGSEVLAATGHVIALQLGLSPLRALQTYQAPMVQERLTQLSTILLRTPPFLDLAIGPVLEKS